MVCRFILVNDSWWKQVQIFWTYSDCPVPRRACQSWEFARSITFWPCLFLVGYFPDLFPYICGCSMASGIGMVGQTLWCNMSSKIKMFQKNPHSILLRDVPTPLAWLLLSENRTENIGTQSELQNLIFYFWRKRKRTSVSKDSRSLEKSLRNLIQFLLLQMWNLQSGRQGELHVLKSLQELRFNRKKQRMTMTTRKDLRNIKFGCSFSFQQTSKCWKQDAEQGISLSKSADTGPSRITRSQTQPFQCEGPLFTINGNVKTAWRVKTNI